MRGIHWRLAPVGLALVLALLVCTERAAGQRAGALPISKEQYERYPVWDAPGAGVGAVTVDLREYLPPVGDQGNQASCVGWAVAYGSRSYTQAQHDGVRPNQRSQQFSPSFIYNQINGGADQGSYVVDALQMLRSKGCATLAMMPYDDGNFRQQPDFNMLVKAKEYRIRGFGRLTSQGMIREAVSLKYPVICVIETTPLFLANRGNNHWNLYGPREVQRGKAMINPDHPNPHGLHAVLIVGYDDARRAFLMMNSWGEEWGDRGYAWLSYDLFNRIAQEPGTFLREAWIVEVFQRMSFKTLINDPANRDKDVLLDAYQWNDYENRQHYWIWSVSLVGQKRSEDDIAHVRWEYTQDGRTQVVDSRDMEDMTHLHGRKNGPGTTDIVAKVRFKDGHTTTVTHRYMFVENINPETVSIRTRDWYWGRQNEAGVSRKYWEWVAWITAEEQVKDRIDHVVWHLNEGDERKDNAEHGFAVYSRGHSPVKLAATLHFMDGRSAKVETIVTYSDFDIDELQLQEVQEFVDDRRQVWDVQLSLQGPLKDRWRIESVTYQPRGVDAQPATVHATDEYDFPHTIRVRVGSRFDVSALVRFDDGTTQTLSHTVDVYESE